MVGLRDVYRTVAWTPSPMVTEPVGWNRPCRSEQVDKPFAVLLGDGKGRDADDLTILRDDQPTRS